MWRSCHYRFGDKAAAIPAEGFGGHLDEAWEERTTRPKPFAPEWKQGKLPAGFLGTPASAVSRLVAKLFQFERTP